MNRAVALIRVSEFINTLTFMLLRSKNDVITVIWVSLLDRLVSTEWKKYDVFGKMFMKR